MQRQVHEKRGESPMCYCTPERKIPYCGKPACQSPAENVPSASISQEAWLEASATKTLDMAEMDALILRSQQLYEDYEGKKKIASEALAEYDKVEAAIMQALRDAGKKTYKVDGLGTVSLVQKSQVTVPKSIEAKKRFFQYLRTKGEDVLFGLTTVNSNTLNSWYQRELDEASANGILGFSVPGVDAPTMRETMAFRKDAKKGR
jgi:hypothetical protein